MFLWSALFSPKCFFRWVKGEAEVVEGIDVNFSTKRYHA